MLLTDVQRGEKLTRRQSIKLGAACIAVGAGPTLNHGLAAPPQPIPAVAVLDDCDPNYEKGKSHDDGLRILASDGKEIGRIVGLNNCQSIAMNHGIALDPERKRIYARELVEHRITVADLAGTVSSRINEIRASSLAIDPKTGDLWCLVDKGSIDDGEIVVLNNKGISRAHYPIRGTDIVYNPDEEAFWVVGRDFVRVDRQGKELLKFPNLVAWTCVSIVPIPRTRSAWVIERRHPQVTGSSARLLRISARGEILQAVERENWNPIGVACEPKTSMAWVVDMRKGLVRVPRDQDALEPLPIPALAIAISSTSGQIWAATENEILRLDAKGVAVVKLPFEKPSGQVWLAAF
jgi:DNA-binding beta-propeller fold protein YncE